MTKRLLFALSFLLATNMLAYAQQGRLQGKVFEKGTREPVSFANIVLENGGTIVGGATSDFDGNYVINPIPPRPLRPQGYFCGIQPCHG